MEKADLLSCFRQDVVGCFPENAALPANRLQKTHQNIYGGCLSRAVFAEESKDPAGFDSKVEIPQDLLFTITVV